MAGYYNTLANKVNPYTNGLALQQPQLPSSSLLDMKLESLSAKSVEKETRLGTEAAIAAAAQSDQESANMFLGGGENYWDVAESSLYQAGSHLYDIVSDQNRTNQEILELSDSKAGLSAQGRERMVTAPQQAVAEELGQGNYLEAAMNLPGATLGTIADSAGSIAEIGGTAVALAAATAAAPAVATGLGLAALGKKLYSGVKVVDKAVDAVDAAKKVSLLTKTANVTKSALKAAPKAAAQVSVATADMTQRQVNTYRENFGEAPSVENVIGMYAANLSTMIFQPGIVKGLFVPAFKKQIKDEIVSITKNLVKGSNIAALGKRVGSGIIKIGTAGLAEGTQEYVQSWVEVLNTKIGPEDTGKFLEAVSREIGDKDNQLQSLLGGYLGFAAGGGIRSATTVPAVAAGGALDLTKATAKGTVKVASKVAAKGASMAADSATRASQKLLSEEERAVERETVAREKIIADQKVEDLQSRIDTIDKAESVEELMADPVLSSKIKEIAGDNTTTEELTEPKMLAKIKAELVSEAKGQQVILKAAAYGSSKARVLGKIGNNVVDAVSDKAKKLLKDVPVEQILESVKDMSEKSVAAVKGVRSSAARGVIELGIREGMKSSNIIVAAARDMEVADLKKVVTVLTESNPELGAKLKKTFDAKVKALKTLGQLNDDVTVEGNVSPVLKSVASSDTITDKQADSVFNIITKTINGKIGDIASLEVVESAVAKYKESNAYKSGANKVSMEVLERRLGYHAKKLRNPLAEQIKTKSAELLSKITSKGVLPYIKDSAVAGKITDLLETNPTLQEFKAKVKELIAKIPDMPDMPDINTEKGLAEFEASIDKAYNLSLESVKSAAKVTKKVVLGDGKTKTVYDATGKPYSAQVVSVSEEGGSTIVENENGEQVIVGLDPSAVYINVNDPKYKVNAKGNKDDGSIISELSDNQLNDLISSEQDLNGLGTRVSVDAVMNINAAKLELKRRKETTRAKYKKTLASLSKLLESLPQEIKQETIDTSVVPTLVARLKASGFTTVDEVNDFLSGYPDISNSATITALINSEFEVNNENVFDEEVDIDSMTVEEVDEALAIEMYNKFNPKECAI